MYCSYSFLISTIPCDEQHEYLKRLRKKCAMIIMQAHADNLRMVFVSISFMIMIPNNDQIPL